MADEMKKQDQWLDHNLRRAGERIKLPDEPTPLQQALWKQERAADDVSSGKARSFIRRHRALTLATTAVAAAVVLAVMLVTPRGSMVEASVILNSLRMTLLDGFEVSFENIGDDGVFVDGVLRVSLRPVASAARGLSAPSDPSLLEVESAYARMRLQGDPADERKAGLDLRGVVALSDDSQWAYMRMSGLPEGVFDDHPLAWALIGMTSCGFLIDMGDMRDVWDSDDSGLKTAPRSAAGKVERSSAAQLIKDFLIGRAGADQINHILTLIACTARDVGLEEVEPGMLVLSVREFNVDALDPDDAALLRNMTLRVEYRRGVGVESARLEHIGRYDGVMQLSPLNGGLNENLLDKRAVMQSGPTAVLDVAGMRPLLDRLINR